MFAVCSGIFLFLSFPKFGYWIVAWFALVPLLCALRGKSRRQGLFLGFLTGIIQSIGIIYWIADVVVQYGYLPLWLGLIIMMLLATYLALFMAIFGAAVTFFTRRGISAFIAAPLSWTCLEYGRAILFTGFPWGNLAHSQYLNNPLIQIADITGTYGISFLIVLVNVVFCKLIFIRNDNRKQTLFGLATVSVLILLVLGYGCFRIDEIKKVMNVEETKKISLIQGNIDQSRKWDPLYQSESVNIYKTLTLKCQPSSPDLVIWPETATPFFFQNVDDLHRQVIDVAMKMRSFLLLGSPSYFINREGFHYQNSAFLISSRGKILDRYDKVHLVPYGEYVPFRRYFPFIEKLTVGVGDFLPGRGFRPVELNDHKVGILICYEGIFPEISRKYKEEGAALLVNLTNDAWFGKTSAPFQHLSMMVFRAVENRVYLLRAANTGISAIIDPTGSIVAMTPLFETTALNGTFQFLKVKTIYSMYGDLFAYFCFAGILILFYQPGGQRDK